VSLEHKVAVIVRVAFDEGALTGKFTAQTKFSGGEFRNNYFAGDRLERTVKRVGKIKADIGSTEPDMATTALKFALKPAAVSTVIPGIRNERQAELNCGVSDQAAMSDELEIKLREHAWRRGIWYSGKD
jgi:aryl-alcohol dehydrogenase-like predicted oxidoreductase